MELEQCCHKKLWWNEVKILNNPESNRGGNGVIFCPFVRMRANFRRPEMSFFSHFFLRWTPIILCLPPHPASILRYPFRPPAPRPNSAPGPGPFLCMHNQGINPIVILRRSNTSSVASVPNGDSPSPMSTLPLYRDPPSVPLLRSSSLCIRHLRPQPPRATTDQP